MTRFTLAFVSLAVSAISLHGADEQIVASDISAVTVYTDRAEVTRTAELDLAAGTHALVFADLPNNIDRNSLQVDGVGGFSLQDVRFETRQLTDLPEGRLKELQAEREKLERTLEQYGLDRKRIDQNREALNAMLSRVTTTPNDGAAAAPMDAVQWSEMLSFYNQQLEKLDVAQIELQVVEQETREEISRVQREMNELNADRRRQSNTARVLVSAGQPGKVQVELTYLVYGPRWYPSYAIRANTEAGNIDFTYYGNVRQSTGEDWTTATLKLSTAQPQVGGRSPELHPWFVQELKPMPAAAGRTQAKGAAPDWDGSRMSNQLVAADAANEVFGFGPSESMHVPTASVESGATAVVFEIPGQADIASDNQPVRVTIANEVFGGTYRYSAVPKLSPHVYLKAKMTNTSDYAFLPGTSNIYLDGSYVGEAQLDLVPPGGEEWVWLGIDQGVKVERKLLTEEDGTSGFFGGNKKRTFSYVFEIENNKRKAIELVLWDQLPIPQNEKIEVKLIEPDSTSDTFKINDEKFVEWIVNLSAGQKRTIPYQFSVTWPEDMQVSGL